MAHKLSYPDQITRLFRQAAKKGDTLRARYYDERVNGVACASYDTFIASWAGQQWLQQQQENAKTT
jgi:hypothetical protein